ncbi:MAG: recombination protein RecR [Planctomycetota bacterium]|nr:MAG: recombination protein RecR [Planctomycetota bacterium]
MSGSSYRKSGGGAYPEPVERLIAEFTKFPGIGRRGAERMAFHLLKAKTDEAMQFSKAVADVKQLVRACSVCFNLTDDETCRICRDEGRDAATVLVVEQPRDLIGLEQAGTFRGVYHVLMGRLDPLAGVGPDELSAVQLLDRIDNPATNARGVAVREVILGLNPNFEGDTTALYLAEQLLQRNVRVTRLARGLPVGSQLEFASTAVLADAIEGRQELGGSKTSDGPA